ncbi:hypothetical protein EI94DRAFT_624566 [Lactarius quietus]|nr:hypothetical protein EI94DRAFT_624566 [Lactarius quietus]
MFYHKMNTKVTDVSGGEREAMTTNCQVMALSSAGGLFARMSPSYLAKIKRVSKDTRSRGKCTSGIVGAYDR